MITYSKEAQRPNRGLKLNSYVENEVRKRVTGLLHLQHTEMKGKGGIICQGTFAPSWLERRDVPSIRSRCPPVRQASHPLRGYRDI